MRRISSSSSMSRTCSYTRTPSARAQSQGVAFLPVPQSKVKDAAALGGQQLEGQPDQLGFHADAQLIVEQVTAERKHPLVLGEALRAPLDRQTTSQRGLTRAGKSAGQVQRGFVSGDDTHPTRLA